MPKGSSKIKPSRTHSQEYHEKSVSAISSAVMSMSSRSRKFSKVKASHTTVTPHEHSKNSKSVEFVTSGHHFIRTTLMSSAFRKESPTGSKQVSVRHSRPVHVSSILPSPESSLDNIQEATHIDAGHFLDSIVFSRVEGPTPPSSQSRMHVNSAASSERLSSHIASSLSQSLHASTSTLMPRSSSSSGLSLLSASRKLV